MNRIFFSLILFHTILFSHKISNSAFAWHNQYGIIKGTEVNLRSAPSINSGIVRRLMNREFVIYYERSKEETKIGKDKDYWYKIKTTDNMQGWVFGKYFYYLDERRVPEKYYKYIIEDYIIDTQLPDDNGDINNYQTIIFDVSFKFLDDKGYIIFKYQSFNKPAYIIMGAATLFYKIEDAIPRMVIHSALNDDKGYYFIDKYIFTIGKLGISVFDTTKEKKGPYAFRKDKVYNVSDSLHLRKWLKKDLVYNDSYIEFDEKTLIATMHLRDEKDKPMRIEKFRFNGTKFEKIE